MPFSRESRVLGNSIEKWYFFMQLCFSVMFRIKILIFGKNSFYNIIEQHEKKEMALAYDKNTYQTKIVMHRRCRIAHLRNAFLLAQLKK